MTETQTIVRTAYDLILEPDYDEDRFLFKDEYYHEMDALIIELRKLEDSVQVKIGPSIFSNFGGQFTVIEADDDSFTLQYGKTPGSDETSEPISSKAQAEK